MVGQNHVHIMIDVPHMVSVNRFEVVHDQLDNDMASPDDPIEFVSDDMLLDVYLTIETNVEVDVEITYKGLIVDGEITLFNNVNPLVFNPIGLFSTESQSIYVSDVGDGVYSTAGAVPSAVNNIVLRKNQFDGGYFVWGSLDTQPSVLFEITLIGNE